MPGAFHARRQKVRSSMLRAKTVPASSFRHRGIRFAPPGPLLALVLACSSDPEPPPNPNRGSGWVTIARGIETTSRDLIELQGSAFISPTHWRCCTGSATDTGVTVTWSNVTTGATGTATQQAAYCWLFQLYLCAHTWSASIELAPGPNDIRVDAQDPGENYGTAAVTIRRVPAVAREKGSDQAGFGARG
jgi:hypothetical protein